MLFESFLILNSVMIDWMFNRVEYIRRNNFDGKNVSDYFYGFPRGEGKLIL
jgi:hypothetical protein